MRPCKFISELHARSARLPRVDSVCGSRQIRNRILWAENVCLSDILL